MIRLDIKPANDGEWQPTPPLTSLGEAEARARTLIACGYVTPDGVRIMYCPDDAPPVSLPHWVSQVQRMARAS